MLVRNVFCFGVMVVCLGALSGCFAVAAGGAGAVGVTAAQERSVGTAVDDNVIYAEISSLYVQNKFNDLYMNISVAVDEGRVLLTGTVKDPETRVEAVRLAWQPKGVKEVSNEIQVTDKSSIKDIANDTWITAQVRSKLLFNKGIRSINYSVDTVNGVVYLMGLAKDEAELNKATYLASTVKGVRKVVSHVRYYDDERRQ